MFVVGLLFGFIFSGGLHVYDGGSKEDRIIRMRAKESMKITRQDLVKILDAETALKLIGSLVSPDSNLRPTASVLIEDSFFMPLSAVEGTIATNTNDAELCK